jgi:hypothetical protein
VEITVKYEQRHSSDRYTYVHIILEVFTENENLCKLNPISVE